MIANDMVRDDECIPFPHEAHQVLVQELLHIFGAGVLVSVGVGAGLAILGGLLSGARVVAVCNSKAHQKFVQANIFAWLKERKIVPATMLAKPNHLLQYEQKKGGKPVPKPAPAPIKPPETPSPSPISGTSPTVAGGNPSSAGAGSSGTNQQGAPGRNLLSAFGQAAM